jgi:Uma2 family endonuclease
MGTQPQTGLTYQDIEALPEERRELIDGELIVPSSPSTRHQLAVSELLRRLANHAREHGGVALTAPYDIKFSDINVLQPDVLYVAPENLAIIEEKFASKAPDLVVEVSSPSTRKLEHLRKRELYEAYGVREYWVVDIEVEQLAVYRLEEDRFGAPAILGPDDILSTPVIPGLEIPLEDVLRPRLGKLS